MSVAEGRRLSWPVCVVHVSSAARLCSCVASSRSLVVFAVPRSVLSEWNHQADQRRTLLRMLYRVIFFHSPGRICMLVRQVWCLLLIITTLPDAPGLASFVPPPLRVSGSWISFLSCNVVIHAEYGIKMLCANYYLENFEEKSWNWLLRKFQVIIC